MVTTRPTRLFANDHASTLYVTIPAQNATDSAFPFRADDSVAVTIDGNRLVLARDPAEGVSE